MAMVDGASSVSTELWVAAIAGLVVAVVFLFGLFVNRVVKAEQECEKDRDELKRLTGQALAFRCEREGCTTQNPFWPTGGGA